MSEGPLNEPRICSSCERVIRGTAVIVGTYHFCWPCGDAQSHLQDVLGWPARRFAAWLKAERTAG